MLKEKGDYYRRKEDKLRVTLFYLVMKQKLDILEGHNKFEDTLTEDQRDALIKEL